MKTSYYVLSTVRRDFVLLHHAQCTRIGEQIRKICSLPSLLAAMVAIHS